MERIGILYRVLNTDEASSCKIFQASITCLSSVSGAPTAKRNVYLFDKTCIIFEITRPNEEVNIEVVFFISNTESDKAKIEPLDNVLM